jgi:hypothetical protein
MSPSTDTTKGNDMTNDERDARRYRWWRDNIDIIEEDGDGIVGVAYNFQIPLYGIDKSVEKEQTHAELMDAIADVGIASEPV